MVLSKMYRRWPRGRLQPCCPHRWQCCHQLPLVLSVVPLIVAAQCAVVAAPHPKWDERPVAVIVLKPKHTTTLKEVRAFCLEKFAKFQLPDDLIFVNELPLTGTGKVSKKDIRKNLQEQGYLLPDLRTAGSEKNPTARL